LAKGAEEASVVRLEVDSEPGQKIGAAGLGGDGSVTVFDHGDSGGGDHEGAGARDIETPRAVAAGANDVNRSRGKVAEVKGACFVSVGLGEGGDDFSVLAKVGQGGEVGDLVIIGQLGLREEASGQGGGVAIWTLASGELGG
jgi:hypothetical protein